MQAAAEKLKKSIKEESVVREIMHMGALFGIVLFREKERIPMVKIGGKWMRGWSGKHSDPGHPDLHGYIKGWAVERYTAGKKKDPMPIYIEVKRPVGGVVSSEQLRFITQLKMDGVPAMIARGWLDVVDALREYGLNLPEVKS